METLLQYERESYGRRLLMRGILLNYKYSFNIIENYLKNKSSVVRYETLNYWYYTKTKEPWAGLSNLLMDKMKRIRLEAGYILEKHNVLNVTLITPYLADTDERFVKAALTAYMNLIAEKGTELYWNYLSDHRAGISKRAFLAIKKNHIHYGAETLYNEFQKQNNEFIKKYLFELLCTEPSTWGRLPCLLRLWGSGAISKEQECRLSKAIRARSMYAQITQDDAQKIREILDELSLTKPPKTIDGLRKSLEFEMKFVTKKLIAKDAISAGAGAKSVNICMIWMPPALVLPKS